MSLVRVALKPLGKLAGIAGSGVLGVLIVESVRSGKAASKAREGAVAATAWGLRAQRTAETKAENLRLGFGDIVAEAREKLGEQSRPPADPGHDHDHEH